MKYAIALLSILSLSACNRAPEKESPPEPVPSPLAPGEAPQASIMRPDMATPTSAPAPVEPLDVVIGFPEGGSEISREAVEKLEKLVDSVQVKENGPIKLAAHSDSAGSDEANLRASQARGEAVRDWLVGHGIAKDRIELIAFGEQNPVEPNALPDGSPNEKGRAANRRVEISVPVRAAPSAQERQPTLAEEIVERTGEIGTISPAVKGERKGD